MNQINLDALLQINAAPPVPATSNLKLSPDTLYQAVLHIGNTGAGALTLATPQGTVQIQLTPAQTQLLQQPANQSSTVTLSSQANTLLLGQGAAAQAELAPPVVNPATTSQTTSPTTNQTPSQVPAQPAMLSPGSPLPAANNAANTSATSTTAAGQAAISQAKGVTQTAAAGSQPVAGDGKAAALVANSAFISAADPDATSTANHGKTPIALQVRLQPASAGLITLTAQRADIVLNLPASRVLQILGADLSQSAINVPVELQRQGSQLSISLPNRQQLLVPLSWLAQAKAWPEGQSVKAQLHLSAPSGAQVTGTMQPETLQTNNRQTNNPSLAKNDRALSEKALYDRALHNRALYDKALYDKSGPDKAGSDRIQILIRSDSSTTMPASPLKTVANTAARSDPAATTVTQSMPSTTLAASASAAAAATSFKPSQFQQWLSADQVKALLPELAQTLEPAAPDSRHLPLTLGKLELPAGLQTKIGPQTTWRLQPPTEQQPGWKLHLQTADSGHSVKIASDTLNRTAEWQLHKPATADSAARATSAAATSPARHLSPDAVPAQRHDKAPATEALTVIRVSAPAISQLWQNQAALVARASQVDVSPLWRQWLPLSSPAADLLLEMPQLPAAVNAILQEIKTQTLDVAKPIAPQQLQQQLLAAMQFSPLMQVSQTNSSAATLAVALQLLLGRLGNQPAAEVKSSPAQKMQQLVSQLDNQQSSQLLRQLSGHASKMQGAQLATIEQQQQPQQQPQLYLQLPLVQQGESRFAELAVTEREAEGKEGDKTQKQWQLTMKFDLPDAGRLLVQVRLTGAEVQLQFYAEQPQVVTAAEQFLPLFKDRLKMQGILVVEAQCQLGKIPEQLYARSHSLLAVRV